MPFRTIVIRSLGDLDDHTRLYVHCQNWRAKCHHSAELDIDALIKRLGPDFEWAKLRYLKCAKCGSRRILVQQVYDQVPRSVRPPRPTGSNETP